MREREIESKSFGIIASDYFSKIVSHEKYSLQQKPISGKNNCRFVPDHCLAISVNLSSVWLWVSDGILLCSHSPLTFIDEDIRSIYRNSPTNLYGINQRIEQKAIPLKLVHWLFDGLLMEFSLKCLESYGL